MELNATFMGSIYPIGKRVVKGFGGFTLCTGKVITPWLKIALIEGITLRPYLEDYRVKIVLLQKIEQRNRLCLLGFGAQSRFAWPVDIGYGCNPCRPEFAHCSRWFIGRLAGSIFAESRKKGKEYQKNGEKGTSANQK
jgi:hypothetical protein